MSGHTPGPWYIRGQDILGNELNGYICTWSGRSADSYLISAAPELLSVLETYYHDGRLQSFSDREKFRFDAKLAIDKARGKS